MSSRGGQDPLSLVARSFLIKMETQTAKFCLRFFLSPFSLWIPVVLPFLRTTMKSTTDRLCVGRVFFFRPSGLCALFLVIFIEFVVVMVQVVAGDYCLPEMGRS